MLDPPSENVNENDAVTKPESDGFSIEMGTVGWDDGLLHYDLGSTSNDGATLVKVSLYRGYDPTIAKKDNIAQGRPVLAQIMGPSFYVPPAGSTVVVAFPRGIDLVPGAAVILGVVGGSPSIQFKGQATDGTDSRAVLDFGPLTDVIIKGKSVTLSDYSNNFAQVGAVAGGSDLIKFVTSSGDFISLKVGAIGMATVASGAAKSMFSMTTTAVDIIQTDGATTKWKGGNWQTVASGQGLLNCGNIGLGASPSVPILIGLTGMAGIGSTTMFGTP